MVEALTVCMHILHCMLEIVPRAYTSVNIVLQYLSVYSAIGGMPYI